MAKPPGKCFFCGGYGLTKEHVWAEWLNPHLPKNVVNHNRFSETIFPTRSVRKEKLHSGSVQSGRLRRVCLTCNTGWMSRLQETAKPLLLRLISGMECILTRKDKYVVSNWITMFCMVSEFLDPTKA